MTTASKFDALRDELGSLDRLLKREAQEKRRKVILAHLDPTQCVCPLCGEPFPKCYSLGDLLDHWKQHGKRVKFGNKWFMPHEVQNVAEDLIKQACYRPDICAECIKTHSTRLANGSNEDYKRRRVNTYKKLWCVSPKEELGNQKGNYGSTKR